MRQSATSLLVTALVVSGAAHGCTLPVFRYALDRWEPDALRLEVPPSSQVPALVELLRPLRANPVGNLQVVTRQGPGELQASLHDGKPGSNQQWWSGELNANSLNALLDSPARREIRRHLLDGESMVWVLLPGADPADATQVTRIEKRLRFLEQVAALPIQDPNDPDSQMGPGPALRLAIGSMVIKADAGGEDLLRRQLAGPKADASTRTGFAAVVFGRGRVLGSWPLEELDDRRLEDSTLFLLGTCSCRVKNENPGWDLLMGVDWPKALAEVQAKRSTTTTPAQGAIAAQTSPGNHAEAAEITTQPGNKAASTKAKQGLSLSLAAALALAGFWLLRRRQSNP